jgi:hypothetical protein
VLFDATSGGFGATAFGTWFGSSTGSGTWGLFDASVRASTVRVECEKCGRLRRTYSRGGGAFLGSYVAGSHFYVVASDVGLPLSCFRLRFSGPETHEVELQLGVGSPPPILADAPAETSPTLPPGEPWADTQLLAPLPETTRSGHYDVSLVDTCAGTETPLATIFLEAPPMLLQTRDADLSPIAGVPILLHRLEADPLPNAGARSGIPFDYCDGVIEYDARLGTGPAAQGWTHQTASAGNPSNFTVVTGGTLQIQTGAGNDSYWQRSVVLPDFPSRVFVAAQVILDFTIGATPAAGLFCAGRVASGGFSYMGAGFNVRGRNLYATDTDFGGEQLVAADIERGWHNIIAERGPNAERVVLGEDSDNSVSFGTSPGPAPSNILVAEFGDRIGDGVQGHLRNIIVSTPGRFVRALFTSFTQTSSPVLRLYAFADTPLTADRSVRFRIRYGSATAAPHGLPSTVVEQTVVFAVTQTVYEIPVTLPGLAANSTVRISIERVWDSIEDTMQGTAWLTHATLRAA